MSVLFMFCSDAWWMSFRWPRMHGFRDPKRTQQFLSCFGPIRQHFALKRHLLRASLYRKQLAARFVDWREFTQLAQNPSTGF
jgi:putative transposase